jgi:spore germination protein YaaH
MRTPLIVALLCGLIFLSACRSNTGLVPPEEEDRTTGADTGDEIIDLEAIDLPLPPAELPRSAFGEIWGYVVSGSEDALKLNYPLSDIAYFSAEVSSSGGLIGVPNRNKIARYKGRVHLVVVCESRSLSHFVLDPENAARGRLIKNLLKAAGNFEGLQIDFELVPAEDSGNFLSFLEELRAGLGSKMLTVALPARLRRLNKDTYDYAAIAPLVDRIFVMAYDEHWSGSSPGPVASLGWCKQVADYSLKTIGPEKLIMGVPFYGRAWGSERTDRAYFYSGIERILTEQDITEVQRENGIPRFTYEIPVTVTVYYDDVYSLSGRLEMYRKQGVASVGFWRLGYETLQIWRLLELQRQSVPLE